MAQIRELLDQSQEQQTREQLDFLLTAAKAKLDTFVTEINDIYRFPEKQEGIQVVGNRAVASYKEYRADVSQGVDSQISELIDKFFSGTEEGIKNGFVDIIKVGLQTILGNESAGEQEQHFFCIVPNGLVITRMDVKCWRYNYSSTGIIGKVKNAFCFYTSLATVNLKSLTPEEIVFFYQQLIGPDIDKIKEFIEKLKELYGFLKDKSPEEVHAMHLKQVRGLGRLNSDE
ncbi:hypothetical protein [Alicyclobacillus sp. SO9]|uniref:hypothetical protein n=1 Tax=Alicyclobacillus sp. SO9 TaxID=2665646 RepID=UPI0018E89459|nr:hypothetical protein [Alicyclobacillus sp. SO9]QQE79753.1 hypothetical protein GI364_04490 [Alicyclobacillus sp. SO9]